MCSIQVNILRFWLSFNKKQKKYFVITFAMLVFFTNTNSQNIINPTGFSKMDTSVLIKWNGKYGEFTDKRDGKIYRVVKIGNQIWLDQNLAFKPNTGKFWVYDNKEEYVPRFGYLYTWETAKTVCPSGWHLPDKHEFEVLFKYTGGTDTVVYKNLLPSGNSGFNALSVGLRIGINFIPNNEGTAFWSASEFNKNSSWALSVGCVKSKAIIGNAWQKNYAFSVRCIQDK